ncbi:hypothetical protein CW304_08685 [Bacillus sp. UFRGS-B20]|nr:hypothetical protein CW304_08685 [Bacillus sp. UFRGS-B20]
MYVCFSTYVKFNFLLQSPLGFVGDKSSRLKFKISHHVVQLTASCARDLPIDEPCLLTGKMP